MARVPSWSVERARRLEARAWSNSRPGLVELALVVEQLAVVVADVDDVDVVGAQSLGGLVEGVFEDRGRLRRGGR